MTIEEIKAQCATLSNEELLLIVNNKIRYTETIVRVAQREIRNRGLAKDELKKLKRMAVRRGDQIEGDIQEDLRFWEKVIFFFVFIPRIHYLVLRDYRRKKYHLKIWQAGYYCGSGAIFFMLALLMKKWLDWPIEIALGVWALSVTVALAINVYLFKPWAMRRLTARLRDTESNTPEGEPPGIYL